MVCLGRVATDLGYGASRESKLACHYGTGSSRVAVVPLCRLLDRGFGKKKKKRKKGWRGKETRESAALGNPAAQNRLCPLLFKRVFTTAEKHPQFSPVCPYAGESTGGRQSGVL